MNQIIYITGFFCIFFIVNSFYLMRPVNSALVVPFVLILVSIILNRNFYFWSLTGYRLRLLVKGVFCISAFILLSLFVTIFHGEYDFSYAKNFLSQLIQFLIVWMFLCFLFYSHVNHRCYEDDLPSNVIGKLIVYTFAFQSIIQIAAFLSPNIASIVHLTYSESVYQHIYEGYSGARGLALTGAPGWGISVGYGLAFIFYVKFFLIGKKVGNTALFIGVILLLGAFFTGRSAFLGLILGGVYYLTSSSKILLKIYFILKSLALVLFGSLLMYLVAPNVILKIIEVVFPFVFEIYYNYSSTGNFETRSTNILFNMWSVDLSYEDFLYGQGIFTDPATGKYYMEVDVGYLRNILYGGVFWVAALFIYSLFVFNGFSLSRTIDYNFLFFLLLACLIFEAKAMTVGFNKYMFSIAMLYSLSIIFDRSYLYKR